MSARRRMECKHCQRGIAEGPVGWYHTGTEAARCRDDASFIYAEPPRNIYPSERNTYCGRDHLYKEATPTVSER